MFYNSAQQNTSENEDILNMNPTGHGILKAYFEWNIAPMTLTDIQYSL